MFPLSDRSRQPRAPRCCRTCCPRLLTRSFLTPSCLRLLAPRDRFTTVWLGASASHRSRHYERSRRSPPKRVVFCHANPLGWSRSQPIHRESRGATRVSGRGMRPEKTGQGVSAIYPLALKPMALADRVACHAQVWRQGKARAASHRRQDDAGTIDHSLLGGAFATPPVKSRRARWGGKCPTTPRCDARSSVRRDPHYRCAHSGCVFCL